MLISSIFVVKEINPVQALLWLIAVFLCGGLVMLELGGEFVAILVVLVYIGAIAVLFLFVIMFLNIRLMELNMYYTNYAYIIGLFSFLLIVEILFLLYISNDFTLSNADSFLVVDYTWLNSLQKTTNIEIIGFIFFTVYYYYFLFLGLILLTALLGTLILLVPNKSIIIVKSRPLFTKLLWN